jgi:hypothetical protein
VLNVEWSDNGEAIVVGYKRGLWEQELERLAAGGHLATLASRESAPIDRHLTARKSSTHRRAS